MKKNIKINDELYIEELKEGSSTITSIISNGRKQLLASINTDDYFWSKVVFDKNYIVVYSRGCIMNEIPLKIEAAYSIKEQIKLDLSNEKNNEILKNILILKKSFDLSQVLSIINNTDLKITTESEKNELKKYLTSGNDEITNEEITQYILNTYPVLKSYTELKTPLYVVDYINILAEIGENDFWFHAMPQNLNSIKNIELTPVNLDKTYTKNILNEYERKFKILTRKK